MVFVSIYKRPHEGQKDDIVVQMRLTVVVLGKVDDNGTTESRIIGMVETLFAAIPIIDDGIDVSFSLPDDFPELDQLFIEHLIPPCWYALRAINTLDPIASGFIKVTDDQENTKWYRYFEETMLRNKPVFDEDGECHQKILSLLDKLHDNIQFI